MSFPVAGSYRRNASSVGAFSLMRWRVTDPQRLKCKLFLFHRSLEQLYPDYIHYNGFLLSTEHTVGGRNPAPSGMYKNPLNNGINYLSTVCFFPCCWPSELQLFSWWNPVTIIAEFRQRLDKVGGAIFLGRWSGKRCMIHLRHQNLLLPVELCDFCRYLKVPSVW